MTIFDSKHAKWLSLVPFLFLVTTRLRQKRDAAYLIVSSWLPAIWFLFRSSGGSLAEAVVNFALGYLAFVAVYEIGYLANDGWDSKRSADGRQRIPFSLGPVYVVLFVLARMATWLFIGFWSGWADDPVWIVAYGALAIAFAQHNLITVDGLRGASFFQLATLRFALPILGAVPSSDRLLLILVAILFYTYLRFLSYLDSKDLLAILQRREHSFAVVQFAMLAPLALLVAAIANSFVVIDLTVYFLAAYAVPAIAGRRSGKMPG